MDMSTMPDEIWRKIMEMGVESSTLSYRDLCCLSISCKTLNRISSEDSLWSRLLSLDFHSFVPTPNRRPKSLYKSRFRTSSKRDEWIGTVCAMEAEVIDISKGLEPLQILLSKETETLMGAVAMESMASETVRRESETVTVDAWERKILPAESRIRKLYGEIRACKGHIAILDELCSLQKQKLDKLKGDLASMRYHPVKQYRGQTQKFKLRDYGFFNRYNLRRKGM
ncbi:F-box protein SKIP24 [Acorus calamus]|uniref:F-box protein SKIP24 n=1 Tax=Acorus calamus TaxID=4465 RepID=A0AAV9F0D5_ACOCL|nr:F-box protein SKIP24 [Acorus calamus]